MLINLLLKELRNTSFFSKVRKGNALSAILGLITTLAFVVIEVVVFSLLNVKLAKYDGASKAFLIIFLFAVSVVHIFYLATLVRKTLYNKDDNTILLTKPIPPLTNTLAKVLYVYVKNLLNNYVIAVPILFVYASLNFAMPRIYFLVVLYPIFISIFETGVAYLISIPYHEIHKFLKKHIVIQMITSAILSVLLCIAYYYVLSTFLTLVRDNNILSIFSEETIAKFDDISKYLLPTTLYIDVLDEKYESLFILIIISIFVFALGAIIGSKIYLYNLQNSRETKRKIKEKEYKLMSENKALLYKEFKILFEDSSSGGFSYSSLLLMQPILTVLVIIAMNTIFKTGMLSYVTSYFPYILELVQILFVILFASFINTSASFAISREHSCLRTLKTIPVSYRKQVFMKLIVPFIGSTIVTLISLIILACLKQISVVNALLTFIYSITLVAFLEIVSLNSDLKHPSIDSSDSNTSSIVGLISVLIPVLSIGVMFLLNYLEVHFILSFFIAYVIILLIGIPYVILFNKNMTKRFIALEMRN